MFFLWWCGWPAERLAGCTRRNVLWSLAGRLGHGARWVITWPQGCLFKPKSCLDYCSQTLLLYCSCIIHKGTDLESGRRTERGSPKWKERFIMRGGGRSGKREGKEEVWIMSALLPMKQHKQQMKESSGAEEGTAQGQATIRHWMTNYLV